MLDMITRLLTLIAIAIAIVCGPSLVLGQTIIVRQQVCDRGRCRMFAGSGAVIQRQQSGNGVSKYFVITVAHNASVFALTQYNPAIHKGMSVVVDGVSYPAQIEKCSGRDYLMLLSFIETTGREIPVWPITERRPSAGTPVVIQGYSAKNNGQFAERSLVLRSYGPDTITVQSPFDQGESGGPVLGTDGVILGLCEGHDEREIPWGPSADAIRRFLSLPAIGSIPHGRGSQSTEQTGQAGVRPAVPVQSPGMPMQPGQVPVPRDVPPPPIPREPVVTAPVPTQPAVQPVVPTESPDVPTEHAGDPTPAIPIPPVRPVPIPDPISNPIASGNTATDQGDSPATPIATTPSGIGSNQPSESVPTPKPAQSKVAKAVETGLNIWSLLAGAGIVAGTGGIGGLVFAAWRGAKAVKALRDLRQGVTGQSQVVPPMQPVQQQSIPAQQIQAPQITEYPHPNVVPYTPTQGRIGPTFGDVPIAKIVHPQIDANFIPIPDDFRKSAIEDALKMAATKRPDGTAVLDLFKSLLNQRLSGDGIPASLLHK